jgi:hypothetical protein
MADRSCRNIEALSLVGIHGEIDLQNTEIDTCAVLYTIACHAASAALLPRMKLPFPRETHRL